MTTPSTAPASATAAVPTATIIPFPTSRAPERRSHPLADRLVRAAATLSESAHALRSKTGDLEIWRGGFDQAKQQLAVESDRARAIASDGARIAAAIERGDLEGLQTLRREIEERVKAGVWPD
jgi:hypothetical protein